MHAVNVGTNYAFTLLNNFNELNQQQHMKAFSLLTCLGLTLAACLHPEAGRACHPDAKQQQDDPKYKYDDASTLSGIDLKPGLYTIEVKTTGTTFWKKIRIGK